MFLHVRVGPNHCAYARVCVLCSVAPTTSSTMTDATEQQATYAAAAAECEDPFPEEGGVAIGTSNAVTGIDTSAEKHPGADDRLIGQPTREQKQEGDVEIPPGWWGLMWARRPNKREVKPSRNNDGTALLLTRVPNDAAGVVQFSVQHFSGRKVELGEKAMTQMDENAKLVAGKLAMTWNQYEDPNVNLTLLKDWAFLDDAPDDIHEFCLKEETADGSVKKQRESYWVFKGRANTDNALDEWLERFKPGSEIDSGTGAEGSKAATVRAEKHGGSGDRWRPYAGSSKGRSWDQEDSAWGKSSWSKQPDASHE